MHIKAIKEPTATNKRGPDSFESISRIRTDADEHISCNFNNSSEIVTHITIFKRY